MKTKIEIKAEIRKQEGLLTNLKDKYSRMHQIDMQGGDGNQMRTVMNRTQGFIDGLNWVISQGDG